ncbi:MAG: hypothetical protein JNL98_00645 [Bryobacterales bacterium]|nr:hypothetical protein [Bryobacterales bacterium]
MKTLVLLVTFLVVGSAAFGQPKSLKLESTAGLTLHNAIAAPVTFQGKKAIKVTISPDAAARMQERAAEAKKAGGMKKGGGPAAAEALRMDHLVLADGVDFTNGTIEVELAGEPGPAAAGGARGFVGVAFRTQPDRRTYDCFYLRPTNGRVDDQERRNHSAQYISHPEFTWFKLRQETPSKYESYVDIGPAEWIRVKIDVDGEKAKLFVNGAAQPALIVNDLKTGPSGKGAVALWFEGSTIAHFANLKITPR